MTVLFLKRSTGYQTTNNHANKTLKARTCKKRSYSAGGLQEPTARLLQPQNTPLALATLNYPPSLVSWFPQTKEELKVAVKAITRSGLLILLAACDQQLLNKLSVTGALGKMMT